MFTLHMSYTNIKYSEYSHEPLRRQHVFIYNKTVAMQLHMWLHFKLNYRLNNNYLVWYYYMPTCCIFLYSKMYDFIMRNNIIMLSQGLLGQSFQRG